MPFCAACLTRAEENKDYLNADDKKAVSESECMVHPSLANWRFWRALKSIQYWAGLPEGFKDKRCPTPITLGEGWVHRRNAEIILFDYEKYFIDLAIDSGILEQKQRGVVSRALRLTDTGNTLLFEHVKGKVG